MSDTADLPGRLGRNPVVRSTSLAEIERRLPGAATGGRIWRSTATAGLVVFLYGIDWGECGGLLDPDTLDVVSSYPLKATPGIGGKAGQKTPILGLVPVYARISTTSIRSTSFRKAGSS